MRKTSSLSLSNFFFRIRVYSPVVIFRFLVSELVAIFWNRFVKGSYSQKYEDLYIDGLLGNKRKGFYVDVGAFDPDRFSNTKRFYLKGWTGINVEPDSGNIGKFYRQRPLDVNLNMGIGAKKGKMFLYKFIPSSLSTLSLKESNNNRKKGFKLIGKEMVDVLPLSAILKKYVGKNKIDFLSVDTEGLDLTVLRSNDWKKFRPRVICVERGRHHVSVKRYLSQRDYSEKYKNDINSIYIHEE